MTSTSTTNSGNNSFSIAVQGLGKRFNREWIFRDLNFQFNAGDVYAITGPNGSGKSTLMQIVWGQVPPTTGTIRYMKASSDISPDDVYMHVSIATPYMDLIDEFSLDEMLAFHFKLKKLRAGYVLSDLPAQMYLEDAREKQLVNFSSGMKQRLKLALAFYSEADIYFLDEPGTNLDSRAFDWYRRELDKLPGHAIVMIASNNREEYPETATNLHIMDFKR